MNKKSLIVLCKDIEALRKLLAKIDNDVSEAELDCMGSEEELKLLHKGLKKIIDNLVTAEQSGAWELYQITTYLEELQYANERED